MERKEVSKGERKRGVVVGKGHGSSVEGPKLGDGGEGTGKGRSKK